MIYKESLGGFWGGILLKITITGVVIVSFVFVMFAYAVNTTFTLDVTTTGLAVSFVDGSDNIVASPGVDFGGHTRSATCTDVSGTLGTAAEKIKIENPGAADGGWTLTLAASSTTAAWTSASNYFDFNDPGDSGSEGCSDKSSSGDADSYAGQLTVDPSAATLTAITGADTSITKGSSASFDEGTTDSIELLNAGTGSSDYGTWTLTGVSLTQKVPANQAVGNDYSLTMSLTVTAQ